MSFSNASLLIAIFLAAAYIGHRINELASQLAVRPEPAQPDFSIELETICRQLSEINKTLGGGLAALIAIAAVTAMTAVGSKLTTTFTNVSTNMKAT